MAGSALMSNTKSRTFSIMYDLRKYLDDCLKYLRYDHVIGVNNIQRSFGRALYTAFLNLVKKFTIIRPLVYLSLCFFSHKLKCFYYWYKFECLYTHREMIYCILILQLQHNLHHNRGFTTVTIAFLTLNTRDNKCKWIIIWQHPSSLTKIYHATFIKPLHITV